MDDMKAQFATTAAGVFGSGWAWLGCTKDGKLAITGTPNQGIPIPIVTQVGQERDRCMYVRTYGILGITG